MRAIHQLIGCVLCIAGLGSAAATSLDTQDLGSAPPVTSTSSHEGHNRGDVPGSNHGVTPASSDDTGSTPRNGNDHSGAASSAPTPAHRTHLGWQSLLPGSIQ